MNATKVEKKSRIEHAEIKARFILTLGHIFSAKLYITMDNLAAKLRIEEGSTTIDSKILRISAKGLVHLQDYDIVFS